MVRKVKGAAGVNGVLRGGRWQHGEGGCKAQPVHRLVKCEWEGDPVLLSCCTHGLPCGFRARQAEAGLVPSESWVVGPCAKPPPPQCSPAESCDGATTEGIGDTGRTGQL